MRAHFLQLGLVALPLCERLSLLLQELRLLSESRQQLQPAPKLLQFLASAQGFRYITGEPFGPLGCSLSLVVRDSQLRIDRQSRLAELLDLLPLGAHGRQLVLRLLVRRSSLPLGSRRHL
jgi:hypothetical protein